MSFLHFKLYFFPPFHLSYFGISGLFLFRTARRKLSQDGFTFVLVLILIMEHSLEQPPPQSQLISGWSRAEKLTANKDRNWRVQTDSFLILWGFLPSFDKINSEQSPWNKWLSWTQYIKSRGLKSAIPTATLVNVKEFKVLCTWALITGLIEMVRAFDRIDSLPSCILLVNRNQITESYLYGRCQRFRLIGRHFSRALNVLSYSLKTSREFV